MVELMLVIGLMGIVMLMAFPTMARYINSSRVAGAANTLVGDLRYGRALANSQRNSYQFRSTATGYSLVRVSTGTSVLTRQLQGGVTIAAADTATFYAWGLTQPKTITLSHQDCSRVVRLTASGQVTHD